MQDARSTMMREQPVDTSASGAVLTVAFALMAVGIVMVASTTASLDRSLFDAAFLRSTFGRQCVFVAFGLAIMLITSVAAGPFLASARWRRGVSIAVFAVVIALLVAALIPGIAAAQRGSHRWLQVSLGGMGLGFQPSEFAKPVMVAMLALYLTQHDADPRSLRRCFLPAAAIIGVCVLLVGKEDFGTSVLLAGVGGLMLLVGGCRLRHLGVVAGVGALAMTALLFSVPYRLQRLAAYRDIWADPQGAGYQPVQSLATIVSGGWLGQGLGAGVQKYGYLPESHTDFIFAVICEEMGLVGGLLVIALFVAFVWIGVRIMLAASSRFERMLAFGLTATIGLQAAMNVAVVTVAVPTTGISLPLISAGGSGLVAFSVSTGLLAAIAARTRVRREHQDARTA